MTSPETPVAYSAVFSNNVASLFYARRNGKLAELFQPSNRPNFSYDQQSVKQGNGVDIAGVTENSLVSAVSWRSQDGAFHTRVYYLGEGRKLLEICRDVSAQETAQGKKWTQGALSTANLNGTPYDVDEVSSLTSLIEIETSKLKVYFTRKGAKIPSVVYTDPFNSQDLWHDPRTVTDDLV